MTIANLDGTKITSHGSVITYFTWDGYHQDLNHYIGRVGYEQDLMAYLGRVGYEQDLMAYLQVG